MWKQINILLYATEFSVESSIENGRRHLCLAAINEYSSRKQIVILMSSNWQFKSKLEQKEIELNWCSKAANARSDYDDAHKEFVTQ